jgi:hypothetical protein
VCSGVLFKLSFIESRSFRVLLELRHAHKLIDKTCQLYLKWMQGTHVNYSNFVRSEVILKKEINVLFYMLLLCLWAMKLLLNCGVNILTFQSLLSSNSFTLSLETFMNEQLILSLFCTHLVDVFDRGSTSLVASYFTGQHTIEWVGRCTHSRKILIFSLCYCS